MFILLVFSVFFVWRIYTSLKEDASKPSNPAPLLVIKSPRRLQLETTIRKIAGENVTEEKMDALCLEAPHVLVTSRAGSGKTMTIAIKTALAVHQGVRPEQTLALCFNKSAARELGNRFMKYGAGNAPTSTFHALAYKIVRPRPGTLLFGERQDKIIRYLIVDDMKKHRKSVDADELIDDVLSFITFVKHRGLSVESVQKRCGSASGFATRVASVYAAYTDHLKSHDLIDFDDLIELATVKLEASDRVPVVRLNSRTCDLNALQLLAIDEAQDLSRSFYGLVQALMRKNPSMQVYAVGDAHQAINGFAGSNLDYFRRFESYFPGGKRSNLLTNYRSRNAIVDYANYHMRGLGEAGTSARRGGSVEHLRVSRYGPVHEVVQKLIACEQSRSVLVLARRNSCHGIELGTWQRSLSLLHPNVRVSSIHRAKGAEADVVFFLKEPNTGNSRLSCLNTVLGVTGAELQEEERRVQYVALTRARERLVVVE